MRVQNGFGSQTNMLSWVTQLLDSTIVFADFPSTQSLVTKYVPLGVLVVLLAASLLKAVRVWEEIHDVEEPDTPGDLLASFEQAHAAGELDDAEFARVREQLGAAAYAPPTGKSGLQQDEGIHDQPPLD
jgi:hypothetical protein